MALGMSVKADIINTFDHRNIVYTFFHVIMAKILGTPTRKQTHQHTLFFLMRLTFVDFSCEKLFVREYCLFFEHIVPAIGHDSPTQTVAKKPSTIFEMQWFLSSIDRHCTPQPLQAGASSTPAESTTTSPSLATVHILTHPHCRNCSTRQPGAQRHS